MVRFRLHTLLLTFMLGLVSACAHQPQSVVEALDPVTGATVTSSNTPLLLYRDNPARAAYARNFLHLGPVEVNQAGAYHYFLWVGAWNTMDPVDPIRHRDGFESITIVADGELFTLDASGWTPEVIGTSAPVYVKPVEMSTDAYYRVTMDQIRLIAEARDVRLRTGGLSPREYQLWDQQSAAHKGLQAFLNAAFF